MIFVGNDWSSTHHDVEVQDETGRRLARARFPEGVLGLARFHELMAEHAGDPGEVIIGIETDRGLWVQALVAAGYEVYAINLFAASRYRDRHSPSGAKSDAGDAAVLASIVRTDRHHHRQVAGDTALAEGVKVIARAQQNLIWSRQREVRRLEALFRDFYPAANQAFDDLTSRDALAVLTIAPSPAAAAKLTVKRIAAALRARRTKARRGRQSCRDPCRTRLRTAPSTRRARARLGRRRRRARRSPPGDERPARPTRRRPHRPF